MNDFSALLNGFRGAIFDFDGTLVDSMPDWSRKMLWQLDEAGIAYPSDIIRRITPMGDRRAAEYFRTLGLKKSTEEILDGMRAYATDAYHHRIVCKPHVPELLALLRDRGVRMCILTASSRDMVLPCLARNGIADSFSFVWCCDDLGMSKTQPEIYRKTAAELGIPPENCRFFDDNLSALRTAHEAGLMTVGVADASAAGDREAIVNTVDFMCDCYNGLISYLSDCENIPKII